MFELQLELRLELELELELEYADARRLMLEYADVSDRYCGFAPYSLNG